MMKSYCTKLFFTFIFYEWHEMPLKFEKVEIIKSLIKQT